MENHTVNPADRDSSGTRLLTLRAAVILLLGVLSGVGAGILTFFAGNDLATCAMAGCGSGAMAVLFFHSIIN